MDYNFGEVLSLHVWGKTLCSGMPALRTITTKSATAAKPRKSQDKVINPRIISVSCLDANKFLRG
jgi:hypothetical protein